MFKTILLIWLLIGTLIFLAGGTRPTKGSYGSNWAICVLFCPIILICAVGYAANELKTRKYERELLEHIVADIKRKESQSHNLEDRDKV